MRTRALGSSVAICCFAWPSISCSANNILQQIRQLGLADCQCREYDALLESIHQAAAAGGDVVQPAQPASQAGWVAS